MKNLKKNQIVISVIALMLVMAGYLSFSNNQNGVGNLLATSSLADSEQMAEIGDATLVSANQVSEERVSSINNLNEVEETEVTTQENTQVQEDSYFAQSRLDRDNMYSQMLENYQKILETNNLDTEEKTNAQEEIKRLNEEKNAIMIAENLIKTKGFEDVVLFVNNGNVSAIIKTEKLEENQIAQIQNVITRELNVKVNKINVSNKT